MRSIHFVTALRAAIVDLDIAMDGTLEVQIVVAIADVDRDAAVAVILFMLGAHREG